ncbi:ketopantoate reductase family protein [Pseudorhodoferax sp.]|uniref:ketopantoate reductase family protein n=1 Tax=Pseudorhodoferax sp. TaxID=1993553 RepID=UPI0039E5CCB2
MRIAVIGAGAVGSYFGGLLARAGHEVTLIGRPAHVEAIRRDGLLIETAVSAERVCPDADIAVSAATGAQLVLFCVKSTDTVSAGAAVAPYLAAGCTLLSLQNGIDNAARLASAAGRPALPCVVHVATALPAPGHVQHRGGGRLVLPDRPEAREVAGLLWHAAIDVELSDNLPGAQWAKLIVNCAYNALSAVARQPFGPLLRTPGVDELMHDVVRECLAVAQAAGIDVQGDPWVALRRTGSQSEQYSSMAQDMARGRRTEIDHLNGYVVRQGEALGVPTPANRCLQVAVKLLEARGG